MTQVLADAGLSERLKAATGPVRVVDETGQVLGLYRPLRLAPPGWAMAHSPHTAEEIERRRQAYRANPGAGKSLAEILTRLRAEYGDER